MASPLYRSFDEPRRMMTGADPRTQLSFRFRGQTRVLDRFAPRTTLLDWLREEAGATGTKEGCGEGDCGACTVVLSHVRDGRLTYEPVNACILLLGQVDGANCSPSRISPRAESASRAAGDGRFSRLAMRLLHARHRDEPVRALPFGPSPATRGSVNEVLAGNLCRCTGYKPIVDAALATCDGAPADRYAANANGAHRRRCAL